MNIIKEGSITIHDSQTGQKQTYNLCPDIVFLGHKVESILNKTAYFAILQDNGSIVIQRVIKDTRPDSAKIFVTFQIDFGYDWEHRVSINMENMTNVISKCKYYRRGRKCTNPDKCPQKYGVNTCVSYLYYSMDLEEQVKELQEWKDANKPTGICETCTDKTLQLNDEYRKLLQSIKPVLEYYGNSKIGEEDEFGMCVYKIIPTCSDSITTGNFEITYDPRPAKKCLQKLKEILGE